jgi:DNA-binding phage protein
MTSSEYFTEVANPAAAEIGNRIHQQYEELVSSLAQVEKYATRTQAALAEGLTGLDTPWMTQYAAKATEAYAKLQELTTLAHVAGLSREQIQRAHSPAHVFFVAPDQRDAGVSAALEAAAGGQS